MLTFAQFLLEQEEEKEKKEHPPFFIGLHKKRKKKKKEDIKEEAKPKLDRLKGGKDDLHMHLSRLHSESVHSEHLADLNKYADDSGPLNEALVAAHNGDESKLQHKRWFIDAMDKAVKKVPTQKDMVVHSGVGFSPSKLGIPKNGKLRVHLPAYTSTSIDKNIARDFAKVDHEEYHYAKIHKGDGKFEYKKVSKELGNKYMVQKYNSAMGTSSMISKSESNEFLNNVAKEHGHVGPTEYSKKKAEKYGFKSHFHEDFEIKPYRHLISLHVPKGSHGVYMGNFHEDHGYREKEFVLPRDSKVDIHSNPRINHNKGTVEWRGTLVHDGVKPLKE